MASVLQPARNNGAAKPAGPGVSRRLVEAELVASVGWLIRIRWIAVIGVLLATWFVRGVLRLGIPIVALSAVGVTILVYNLAFYLAERRLRRKFAPASAFSRLAQWQVGLDWLAMTLLIHYSGGIESPLILFFVFHIIIASILSPARTAYGAALLAVGLISATALLEYFGILPHAAIGGYLDTPLYQNGLFVAAVLLFFASAGLIAAYLTSSIQERLRQREEEVVELSESLQRATARLSALNENARTVNSTLDLPQVMNRLVLNTAEVMGVQACSIRLLDPSGSRLEPVAVHGLSQAYLNKGPVELETNPLAREVLSGKVVNIPDAPNNPLIQYHEEARQEGIHSILSAPLVGKNKPLGIIRAYAVELNRFTPDDESFLAAIAAQGSIAIDNALAYQSIEALDSAKGQFIRMVTHELRSPVSVTRSLLRTITAGYSGSLTPEQGDILNRAIRRVDFLQKLIDDLLDVAAGKIDLRVPEPAQPVALNAVLEKVIHRFEVSAQEKGINLQWQAPMPGQVIEVMATEEALDRIFNNLISNAIKYTPAGGRVLVSLGSQDGEARVTVQDTGIGIPVDSMNHLFEEFYRAPNAKELEREGTGLGLTIVKDLLNRLGGRVSVQSQEGEGSCFTITLQKM